MNIKSITCCFSGATLAITLLSSGCATGANHAPPIAIGTNGLISVAGHEIQPEAMQTACRVAAQGGTIAAVKYDGNARAYLQAAQVVFDTALQNGEYDPVVLNQSLSSISIKEARDPNVTAGIESALGVYSMFFGSVVSAKIADVSPYAVPALTGLRDGIKSGLLVVGPLILSPPKVPKTNVISLP